MPSDIQTHLINRDEISNRAVAIGGYFKDAGDTIRNAGDYSIEITGGFHSGTELVKKPGDVFLGSEKENDLVLFADDVASRHVQISLPSNLLGKVRVTPLERNIVLENDAVVEVGQFVDLDDGEGFDLGSATIEVHRIGNPKNFAKPIMRFIAIVCLVAMIPLLYGVFSGMVTGAIGAGSSAILQIQKQISTVSKGYINAGYSSEKKLSDTYFWTVRTKLEELHLNHRIRVTKTGLDSLRVSGTVMDNELGSWNAFLRWYDSKNGFPSLIRDVRRTDVETDLPRIKSVWLDKEPAVFFRDGTTAKVGSHLDAGWVVIGINNTSVTIERDGATISLTY